MLETTTQSSIHQELTQLQTSLNSQILGQPDLIEKMLITLLADGHLIVEGLPGLAKTRAIKYLSNCINADFQRIQFTPDLLPSDITGTDIFHPQDGSFSFIKGPIFSHLVLADEINRAPAKVQSALLEAMDERQVTVGKHSDALPELFMVMATQNPIEQEGTYPLPEAQLDRFLLHIDLEYPNSSEEKNILALARQEAQQESTIPLSLQSTHIDPNTILQARRQVLKVHTSEHLQNYLIALVLATRNPASYANELVNVLQYGASPRASIGLDRASKARAWLQGRDYVTPDDIQSLAYNIFNHRLILSYPSIAKGWSTKKVIDTLISKVPSP